MRENVEKVAEKKERVLESNVKSRTRVTREPVMYMGPTFPHRLYENTVYKNGIPEVAKKIIEKIPAVAQMFVSLDKVADTKKELAVRNSASFLVYQKIKENVQEG